MSGGRPVTLTAMARSALECAIVEAHTITITGQVPAAAWERLKKILELAGGEYVVGKSRWMFQRPAGPIVQQIIADGHVIADRHTEGYVPTPATLADRVCGPEFADLASLPAGAVVLEPSAGGGVIAAAILRALPDAELWAVEPDRIRSRACAEAVRAVLGGERVWEMLTGGLRHAGEAAPGSATVHTTGLEHIVEQVERAGTARPWFDAVVMNPPYNITGRTDIWIDHVQAAYRLLKPGGRLVAIVPAALTSRNDKRFAALRDLVDRHGGFRPLAKVEFPGARIDIGVLWLDRPGTDIGTRPTWLFRRWTGDEPAVRVTDWQTSVGAALTTPVQVCRDPRTGGDRTLVHLGRCMECPRMVWGFADGENDVRGPLGNHSGGWSLWPDGYGMGGEPACLCVEHGGGSESYSRALERARLAWTAIVNEPAEDDSVDDILRDLMAEAAQLALFDVPAAAMPGKD